MVSVTFKVEIDFSVDLVLLLWNVRLASFFKHPLLRLLVLLLQIWLLLLLLLLRLRLWFGFAPAAESKLAL